MFGTGENVWYRSKTKCLVQEKMFGIEENVWCRKKFLVQETMFGTGVNVWYRRNVCYFDTCLALWYYRIL